MTPNKQEQTQRRERCVCKNFMNLLEKENIQECSVPEKGACRIEQLDQEGLDKEHGEKADDTDQVYFLCFPAWLYRREEQQKQPSPDPADQRAHGIGDQIVDIRCTVGEELQKFNEDRTAETKQKRPG